MDDNQDQPQPQPQAQPQAAAGCNWVSTSVAMVNTLISGAFGYYVNNMNKSANESRDPDGTNPEARDAVAWYCFPIVGVGWALGMYCAWNLRDQRAADLQLSDDDLSDDDLSDGDIEAGTGSPAESGNLNPSPNATPDSPSSVADSSVADSSVADSSVAENQRQSRSAPASPPKKIHHRSNSDPNKLIVPGTTNNGSGYSTSPGYTEPTRTRGV